MPNALQRRSRHYPMRVIITWFVCLSLTAYLLTAFVTSLLATRQSQQTVQDLTVISNALIRYTSSHDNLPANLSDLNLHLHKPQSNYTYSVKTPALDAFGNPEAWCSADGSDLSCNTSGFMLCTNFAAQGKPDADYNQGSDVFAYHKRGYQCYTYAVASYSSSAGWRVD